MNGLIDFELAAGVASSSTRNRNRQAQDVRIVVSGELVILRCEAGKWLMYIFSQEPLKSSKWTIHDFLGSATLNTPVTFSSSYIVLPVHTPSRKFSLNLIFPDMFCPKTLFPSFQRFPVIIFPPWYSARISLSQNLKLLIHFHPWTWYSLDSIS